jgi:hypothetical protein
MTDAETMINCTFRDIPKKIGAAPVIGGKPAPQVAF